MISPYGRPQNQDFLTVETNYKVFKPPQACSMESPSLFRRYNLLSTGQREMRETLTSTVLPEGLSRHINPFHLGAWLSLHFGKGGYYVSARFLEGAFDADGKPRGSYEIWAPMKISEVSMFRQVQ